MDSLTRRCRRRLCCNATFRSVAALSWTLAAAPTSADPVMPPVEAAAVPGDSLAAAADTLAVNAQSSVPTLLTALLAAVLLFLLFHRRSS